MNQISKQLAPKNMEEKMAEMEKLLKKLAAQLNILITGKTKSFGTPRTPAKPAATTSRKNR